MDSAGAMARQLQKMIQRSAKFGTQAEKGQILGSKTRTSTKQSRLRTARWTLLVQWQDKCKK